MKMPNFQFYWGRKQARTKFSFSVFKLEWQQRRQSLKKRLFLLKVTLSLPSPSSMRKLLIVFPLSQCFLMDWRILFKCMRDASCERVVFRKRRIKSPLKKYPDACGRRLKLKKIKNISHVRFLSQILSSRVPRNRERSYVFRWICRTTESPSVEIKELAVTHRLFWI